jgi:CRP/FNR family transcriptional regulator, nitrogen oxide reductase regulator
VSRQSPLTAPSGDPRVCTHDVRLTSLGRVPFFRALDPAALADVDGRCDMRGMQAGQAIHLAGRPAERLHIVATGTVRVTVARPDGTEILLDAFGPGAFVGGLPVLGEDVYADDAWALTDGCLLSLTAAAFDVVLREHPSVARDALAAVGSRLRAANERIQRLAAATAPARVASTLLVLADRLGVGDGGRVLIDAPLSRDDLAHLSGCAPETASRVMARLRREGTVDAGRRWVAVVDRGALEDLAADATG